ncbi:unnamed protein product [Cyclocybe aegerita]|uniref:Uncharacterized protein n=1 Tax=Cyclocybe aegerita TaxID=1973307 RepID=A0A8S0XZC4_CYCAE|nr:unnamed protein product [Cyclocybe aegerita]
MVRHSHSDVLRLSSLTQWSQGHIRRVFESPSEAEAVQAIEDTFSKDVNASLNGKQLGLEQVKQLVLSMHKESRTGGLKVEWKQTVEVPEDPTNRNGSFGGVYIIHGIWRTLSGQYEPMELERHKTVTVRIESQSNDTTVDSRKIVNLVFVASDIPVHDVVSSR